MISCPIKNSAGEEVGTYEFDSTELADGINKQLLHDVVVMYEARKRVGTVKTKSRGVVAGSTKKLFRQKGTGRARMGTKRTPIRRGGGHAFAKSPKDWGFSMPKKAVRAATRMALLSKFQDGEAVVLDSLSLSEPKTRAVNEMLRAVGYPEGPKNSVLLTIAEYDPMVWRSGRNIERLAIMPAQELNAYDLLHQRYLIITKDAMDAVRQGTPVAAAAG